MISSEEIWRNAIVTASITIRDVILNLNQVGIKIVLVVVGDGELVGTISDGDIRRGLLGGLDMSSPITSIINRNVLVVPPGVARALILQLMVANKIQQIPVVNDERCVVGLHLWDEINTLPSRSNFMVVMAGGVGSRLRPFTENCPKPLVPVSGKPLLQHIIERAKLEGFTHFILSVNYLAHMIEDFFGDGSNFGVKIEYLHESSPLGTAGALAFLNPRPCEPFVVTNGDVITDIRYGELLDFHIRQEAVATMAVSAHEWQHPFGVVQMQGVEIVGFEEKPVTRTHINAGVYILDSTALNFLEMGMHCDMPTLFERLQSEEKRTVAYPMHEPWLDVGRPEDLNRASVAIDVN